MLPLWQRSPCQDNRRATKAKQIEVTREIALQASFEMGMEAAKRGHDYFACPLTDHECRMRWADGYNGVIAWRR